MILIRCVEWELVRANNNSNNHDEWIYTVVVYIIIYACVCFLRMSKIEMVCTPERGIARNRIIIIGVTACFGVLWTSHKKKHQPKTPACRCIVGFSFFYFLSAQPCTRAGSFIICDPLYICILYIYCWLWISIRFLYN